MEITRKIGKGVPPLEYCFKPGNPGGSAPKGKRITTWAAEFGEKLPSTWPKPGSKEFEKLPGNAQIALRRLRSANKDDKLALLNTQYVEPRTLTGEDSGSGESAVAAIAAAIMALKAAGVSLRRDEITQSLAPIDVTPESVETQETTEEDEDESERTKRFRRGRA